MQSKSKTKLGYSSLSFSKALLMYISLTNLLDYCTYRGGTGSGSDNMGPIPWTLQKWSPLHRQRRRKQRQSNWLGNVQHTSSYWPKWPRKPTLNHQRTLGPTYHPHVTTPFQSCYSLALTHYSDGVNYSSCHYHHHPHHYDLNCSHSYSKHPNCTSWSYTTSC